MWRRLALLLALPVLVTACGDGGTGTTTSTTTTMATTTVPPTTTTSTTTPPTTASTTTTSTTTTTPPPPPGLAWARVADDWFVLGGDDDQLMADLVLGGPGLIAVGSDQSRGAADAAVWVSEDGFAWDRITDTGLEGPDDQYMNRVAAGGPGLVGVGTGWYGDEADAALWVSEDGSAWTRIDDPGLEAPGDQYAYGIAAGALGLAAGGWDERSDTDAALWVSEDGTAWTRIDDDTLGGPGSQYVYAVAAAGPGFVAVGWEIGEDSDGAMWVSADLLTWERVGDGAVFGGPGDQYINYVTGGGPGLVAVGYDTASGDADAAVWVSEDGYAWTRVEDAALREPGAQAMSGVTAVGTRLVAVGTEGSTADRDAAVWTSDDGGTWTRIESEEFTRIGIQFMYAVIAGGPGVVAVGFDMPGDHQDAAIWVSPPPD